MTQELYIDGILADMDDNSNVWLDVKTNLLSDITKIQSSVTLTISLPMTQNNKRIIGLAQVITQRQGEDMAWRIHTAQYRRNGVTLIESGRLMVVSVGDTIGCTIVWGLYDAVARLLKADVSLNALTEDVNTVLWTGNNTPDTYAAAQAADYFFAALDMWYTTAQDYPWTNSDTLPHHIPDERFRGRRRGTCLHPSVKVSYVLGLISHYCNVTINWSQAAQTIINSMVIPLVDNKANADTYRSTTVVSFPQKAKTERTLGLFAPSYVSIDSAIFRQGSGDNTPLEVTSDADIHATMSVDVQYDMSGFTPDSEGNWKMRGVYCAIIVEHGETDRDYYYCGLRYTQIQTSIKASDYPSGIVSATLTGEGVFPVKTDDKVYFARYWQSNIFGGSNTDPVTTPANDNPPTTFLSGVAVNMRPANIEGQVPANGYYPIESNLPDIKAVDFVKFLAAYTGSFPLQIASDSVITFASLSEVFGNVANAVDWSGKLIARSAENTPKDVQFHPNEWAQVNRYEWQEDERNDYEAGYYSLSLLLDDDTLERERTVMTFPFSASDGSHVPVYTTDSNGTTEGSPCKPRIMQMYDNGGNVAARFESAWGERLMTALEPFRRSLQHAKIITERIALSDIDVMRFDERRPVYLAQYGAFFAVLEIKQSNELAADVTMLRIIQ